ncbi:MAG: glycerol-3-phosphate dehydrogenase/oxidase [Candidatus Eisenbacteria bacterium]|uniref:Glycerol-3-phosphate dehydrogenase/oxidase n=1 Tax=Eiseniibacteriota bacterium TaxID=2212470 RepID=A0A538U4X5_UNCEI|nr:MAG: glycerol-3-phosphate dehydrogenase/oxidase [Candidatus Eisenbacteria bacterium]
MRRDLSALARGTFDVVVVGGGICGACAAWDAALRGLSVALLERGDWSGATSAHSLKVVHGGIRYLQHADIERVRECSFERSAFLRIAPHLVHPLPFVVPTYGLGMRGKAVLGVAFQLLGVLTADRNRDLTDPARRIPGGRLISKAEVLAMFPGLVDEHGLTGAGVFHDGQLHDPPRLVLSVVRAAAEAGAVAANHCEVERLIVSDRRAVGVTAVDRLSGGRFEVRARTVLNAAGPYAEELLVRSGLQPRRVIPLSRDMAIVVPRPIIRQGALAMQTKYRDPAAVLSRGNRHLFMVSWRGYTLIGVNSRIYEETPSELGVTEAEVCGFLDEINQANPSLRLTLDDVSVVNAGLLPFGENTGASADLTFGKRSHLIDHATRGGIEGLVTAMSVRYTTGRIAAEKAVDLAFAKMGRAAPPCRTARTPVHGGAIARIDDLVEAAVRERPAWLSPESARHLVRSHGSDHGAVVRLAEESPPLRETLGTSPVLKAEVVHGVRMEMAQRLTDVVLRRTDLGTGAHPGAAVVAECARLMAGELGWDAARVERELAEVRAAYPAWVRA